MPHPRTVRRARVPAPQQAAPLGEARDKLALYLALTMPKAAPQWWSSSSQDPTENGAEIRSSDMAGEARREVEEVALSSRPSKAPSLKKRMRDPETRHSSSAMASVRDTEAAKDSCR